MANTNITPNAGTVNLSVSNPRLTPLAGALLALGIASVIAAGSISITPTRGTLNGTGQTAELRQQGLRVPATGALTATGETAAPSRSITPTAGTLTAAGVQGVISSSVFTLITPPSGNMTIGLGEPITPGTGTLTLAGSAASIASLRPSAGSLALTGAAPTISSGGGSVVVTPSVGRLFFGEVTGAIPQTNALSLVGGQPSLLVNAIRPPVTGALTFTGTVSNIEGRTRVPGTGSMMLTGATGEASRSLIPGTGALALTGEFASVTGFTQIITQTGALTITGETPTFSITGHVVLSPATGALVAAGNQPSEDKGLRPLQGVLTITGESGSVSGQQATPIGTTLGIDGQLADMRLDVFITPIRGSLATVGFAANINGLPPRGGVRFPGRRRGRVFPVPDREEPPS